MRTLRIISGALIDITLFGILVPLGYIKGAELIDAILFSSFISDNLFSDITGIVLAVTGTVWLFSAWFLLIRLGHGHTTELFCIEIAPVTGHLVVSGPFSLHRHPICVGYIVMLLGIGLTLGSPGAVLVEIPLILLLTYIYLRIFEEPCLEKRFGKAYRDYRQDIPMFIPARRNRIPVAFRNLSGDRVRFLINILGVSLAVLLISFQLSILKGTRGQITTYIDHVGADVWAMQKGVDDFIATSSVPADSVETVENLEGVSRASGIFAVYTLLQINDVKSRVYVIGYDTFSGDGGPWSLGETLSDLKGIRDLKEDEILLDQDLARRHGLSVGDKVSFFGYSFKVAGYTRETMSIGSQYAFLPRQTFAKMLPGGDDSFTHILVWIEKGVTGEEMVRRIMENTSLNAITRGDLADNMRGFLGMFMLPLLTAGVIIGFLVGSITIAITLYTSILERFREYGTLKALGATDLYLYGLILKQCLISFIIGTVLGFAFSLFTNHVINRWVPGMTAELDSEIILYTIIAGSFMILVSTGLPAWRLLKLDPMEAFRS